MVEIQNPEIINRISEDIKESNLSLIPKNLNGSIQPVLISNPDERKYPIVQYAAKTTTGAVNIYTTPTDKDFYLTNILLGWTADAAADNTSISISGQPDKQAAVTLLIDRKQTTTAGRNTLIQSYPIPLKMERGSTFSITTAFAAGTSAINGVVTGFLVDTLKK